MKLAVFAILAAVALAQDAGSIQVIKDIAPSSTSCSGAPYADECITADKVTQPLIDAFAKWKITTPGEQATLLAWMTYESGEFKYNHNHYPAPGRPGQGTRCMMMPNFVAELGKELKVADNSDPAALLTAVLAAGGDYEAASWYYSSKCDDTVKAGVKAGTLDGHKAFMSNCVNTNWDSGREKYWDAAAKAFGLTN